MTVILQYLIHALNYTTTLKQTDFYLHQNMSTQRMYTDVLCWQQERRSTL